VRLLSIALLLVAACRTDRSPYVRITHETGRIYYARTDYVLHSPGGGLLSFRDLVTREQVRLKEGSYQALECPASEIAIRQQEFLEDPTRLPYGDPPRQVPPPAPRAGE